MNKHEDSVRAGLKTMKSELSLNYFYAFGSFKTISIFRFLLGL